MSFRSDALIAIVAFFVGPVTTLHAQEVVLSSPDGNVSTRTVDSTGSSIGVRRSTHADLRPFVDLRKYLPKPGDQKTTRDSNQKMINNSCIAWSIAYASYSCQISQQRRLGDGPTDPIDTFSPSFLMEGLKKESKSTSGGLKAKDALDFVKRNGCASKAAEKAGESKASVEAKTFRATGYARVVNLDDIKTYINERYPVLMIIDLDDNFESDTAEAAPYVWSGPSKQKYHTVTAVGYDESRQALLLMNSWGEGWKNGGFCWVSYKNINAITRGKWCVEAWVLKVKESAPFNVGYITVKRRPYRIQSTDFTLKADGQVYDEDDEQISPPGWEIVGLACNDDNDLFLMKNDLTIYKRHGARTWTHLTTGDLKNKKVTMMAADHDFPLHVLTGDGKVFEYVGMAGPWKAVALGKSGTADLRLINDKDQLHAVADNGDVYVRNEDDATWALAP